MATDPQHAARLAAAHKAFTAADEYQAVRTEYTPESAKHLLRQVGVFTEEDELVSSTNEEAITVLELGCGTGLLTEAMMKLLKGNPKIRYIASDPLQSMADVFQKLFPDVEFMSCTAESIPLPENSVNAILAGTSFHWFGTQQAYKEMYRVVKPGGKLGYITNNIDETDGPAWAKEAGKLVTECYAKSKAPTPQDFQWREALLASKLFINYKEDTSLHLFHKVTMEICHRCLSSYGGIRAATQEDQKEFEDKLWELLHRHFTEPGVEFEGIPHVTCMYFCQTTKA